MHCVDRKAYDNSIKTRKLSLTRIGHNMRIFFERINIDYISASV